MYAGSPNATIHNTFYEVEYGQNVTLECNVTSKPAYTNIYWQKITNDTVTNITSDTSNIDGVSTMEPFLTIVKATTSDSGRYACLVENLIGTGESEFTSLTVVGGMHTLYKNNFDSRISLIMYINKQFKVMVVFAFFHYNEICNDLYS